MEEIKEVNKILFGIASTEDMRNKSVYTASVSKYTENRSNTVYDHRGGALFNKRCETCKQHEQQCPGHFGIIELNAVIIHPLFFTHVFNVLKIICHVCSKLIITREHLDFSNILKFEGEKRLTEMLLKIKKFNKCFHCGSIKRDYKIKKDSITNTILYDNDIEIYDEEVKRIFDDIDAETLNILNMSHPKNCCLEVFPVIPPCCRPYEFVGNVIKEDDLTKQLVEIIKANNLITDSKTDKIYAVNNLKLKIETFCRNPKKVKNINSEPIKGIRERLTGKDGQLRDNLMGKRTEMSGRTVIGPGPNLKIDEVGIPEVIAKNITFPINVYRNNYNECKKLIQEGLVEKIKRGDKIIRIDIQKYANIINFLKVGDKIHRNNTIIKVIDNKITLLETDRIFRNNEDITPAEIPRVIEPEILIGDVIQRRIIDGDWVLMNRQPTLWKGSMMAFKVVISKSGTKTFTFNLAVCKAFNADFDGDEQNAHFPQSLESRIELQLLSTPEECLCSSTNGTPVIVILQDALLGAYLMSKENSMIVEQSSYNDIIMCLSRPTKFFMQRKSEIRTTLQQLGLYKDESSLRTGRSLLALILPYTFNYNSDDLKIKNGVIYEGVLTKKYLGSTKTSFVYLFKMEFGNKECVNFINDIQFMTNKWLTYNSFSVNISDCYQNDISTKVIEEKLLESNFIKKTILNKKLAEAKINLLLSNAKDIGMKIAENKNNNFVETIKSGSKGDYFNLGQVKGLLGQQIINGERIKNQVSNCTRSLIHYPKKEMTLKEEYESRGFIMNSFYKGLNPKEFFFHSMSGRQGVCDTAMTTYMSGYNMRKLVKLTEDIKIHNDGTVADSSGNTYSFAYGDLGLNPESKDVNVSRIIDKLNDEYSS